MRKYIDKDTGKIVIVSHYSIGNTNKIHLVLAPAVSPGTPAVSPGTPAVSPGTPAVSPGTSAVSPDSGVDSKDYKVSLQDFLSNRFKEEFEIEN